MLTRIKICVRIRGRGRERRRGTAKAHAHLRFDAVEGAREGRIAHDVEQIRDARGEGKKRGER